MIGHLGLAYLGTGDKDSTDPGIANVLEAVDYVIDGDAKTGIYHPALMDEVKYGIEFGPNGSLIGNFPPLITGTSFKNVIANLKTVLENDPHLADFCQAKWRKPLTVMIVYKHQTEINLSDMPIILITRPDVKKSFLININRNGLNTVRLYCGFNQDDRLKAQAEFVEFEEKIDDALMSYEPEILGAMKINPKGSINDEGNNHPAYWVIADIEILHRR